MKWVVVTVITLFFLLLGVRLLRRFTLGQATVHIGHMKSEADASQVASIRDRSDHPAHSGHTQYSHSAPA